MHYEMKQLKNILEKNNLGFSENIILIIIKFQVNLAVKTGSSYSMKAKVSVTINQFQLEKDESARVCGACGRVPHVRDGSGTEPG